jgi:hypothetical protein
MATNSSAPSAARQFRVGDAVIGEMVERHIFMVGLGMMTQFGLIPG